MKSRIYILLVIVGLGTHCAGQSIPDSLYYTAKQDSNCLRCLVAEPLKDDLITEQGDLIDLKDGLILSNHLECERVNNELMESNKQEMKVQKFKCIRNTIFSFIGGYILHIFV